MNQEFNKLQKPNLSNSGRLILESTFIFPIILAIVFNLLTLSIHTYRKLETNYVVHHNAIVSVDEMIYKTNLSSSNSHKYTIAFNNIWEYGYMATKDKYKSIQTIGNPIELTRNLDVIRSYINRAEQILGSNTNITNRIRDIEDRGEPETFDSHASAAIYLRNQVLGDSKKIETPMGIRIIDAIDKQGIVHQAFLTFNESQLKTQLKKDRWLLEDGKSVNGVVWHFFKKTGSNYVGPSSTFIQYVQSFGVVIYIHTQE